MAAENDEFLIIGDSMIQKVCNMPNTFVRSYRGDTYEDLANHIHWNLIPSIHGKRVIFIHAGTNDVYTLTILEMLQDLRRLLGRISIINPTAHLYVSAILPRPRDFWTTQDKILEFNKTAMTKQVPWDFTFIHS